MEAAMTSLMAKVGNERRGFDRRFLALLVGQVRDGKADYERGNGVSRLGLTNKLTGWRCNWWSWCRELWGGNKACMRD